MSVNILLGMITTGVLVNISLFSSSVCWQSCFLTWIFNSSQYFLYWPIIVIWFRDFCFGMRLRSCVCFPVPVRVLFKFCPLRRNGNIFLWASDDSNGVLQRKYWLLLEKRPVCRTGISRFEWRTLPVDFLTHPLLCFVVMLNLCQRTKRRSK